MSKKKVKEYKLNRDHADVIRDAIEHHLDCLERRLQNRGNYLRYDEKKGYLVLDEEKRVKGISQDGSMVECLVPIDEEAVEIARCLEEMHAVLYPIIRMLEEKEGSIIITIT